MFSGELNEGVLSITDDSGFLALINAEKYNSFVNNEWTFEQLQQRFAQQANENNLIIWPTGNEGFYKVTFLRQPSNKLPFKKFNGIIRVTNGLLHLTNYEDLTMAAQFQNEKLPSKHNSGLCIKLPNASYDVLVHQMFNPNSFSRPNDDAEFEIVLAQKNKKFLTDDEIIQLDPPIEKL